MYGELANRVELCCEGKDRRGFRRQACPYQGHQSQAVMSVGVSTVRACGEYLWTAADLMS